MEIKSNQFNSGNKAHRTQTHTWTHTGNIKIIQDKTTTMVK